jgi:hypothetical protein
MNKRFLLALPLVLSVSLFSQASAQSATDSLRPCFVLDRFGSGVFCPPPLPFPRPRPLPLPTPVVPTPKPWPFPIIPKPFPIPHPPICPDSSAGCQPFPIDLTR